MPNILGSIEAKDLISFGQNYGVKRNYVGERLFPAVKTPNIEAEMYRLGSLGQLPTLAKVHALDTEAAIGVRPTFEKINVEKFLIKEKLNQSEKTRLMVNHGVDKSGLVKYVYDDLNTLGNAVLARAEKMRTDLLTTGTIILNENGLNYSVDYGVPATNKVSADWGSPEHDILSDIQSWVDIASGNGAMVTNVTTSRKVVRYMQKNKYVQAAIRSALGIGTYVDEAQLNALLQRMFGFTVSVDEDMYATTSVSSGVVSRSQARFFAEDKFVMHTASAGRSLFGITPEEEAYGLGWDKAASMYLTFAQWETSDPVALWSKASTMLVPILENPDGLVIATIGFTGEASLDSLAVTSIAGTASGDTKITVSPSAASGNTYRYKVATDAKLPNYGQVLNTWSVWDGSSDITAATGKEICIAEVNGSLQAIKAGIATVTAKT